VVGAHHDQYTDVVAAHIGRHLAPFSETVAKLG
jgi:hypothetical protein